MSEKNQGDPSPVQRQQDGDQTHISEKKSELPATTATTRTEGERASKTASNSSITDEEAAVGSSIAPPGSDDVDGSPKLVRWNESGAIMYRFVATNNSFILKGMSDGVTGALIPYIETYYNITYTVVSLVFLAPFVGYLVASLVNGMVHHYAGQRGVAVMASFSRVAGLLTLVFHPPYPVLPVAMLFVGFGNGLEDSAWNAWVGNMHNANELLGIMHGAYGLGATIGPLIATAMITKGGLQWYTYYYVQLGADVVGVTLLITSFWGATAKAYRESHKVHNGGQRTTTRQVLRKPFTWLLAVFLLGYVGAEVSLGGWIVTFMLRVRNAEPFIAGLSVTFFWLGLTVGRVVLGFITGRIGEKLAITIYLGLTVVLQVLYWLVPTFAASAVFVTFLGFFLGPLFPGAIVAATKLLPSDQHVSAIGFACAFGGGGAALVPFAVGAIAEIKGVYVLQPIVLAILVTILLLWLAFPGGLRRGGLERARENQEGVGHEIGQAIRWAKVKAGKTA
ncbi:major facilitator superfamily domain-containing protein [Lasiosphaeria ovina]|uniref:Major facilitator superfamily domain-containing protein n=1 Tax=Lasiosphaeria ovina TaxID=92902 RepID=A0AAE0N606_9PEZI|nr:major facilitator superfamily domain-containing protein [Lasiosphaeria ovina]